MELARDKNKSQARYSNCRCAGIAGARRESRCALAWNGRVPSRAARDAGFFESSGKSPSTCYRRSMLWRFTTSLRKPRPSAACSIRRAEGRAHFRARRLETRTACMGVRALPNTPQTGVTRHLYAVTCRRALILFSDAGFSNADVSPSLSPRYAARTMRRMTFAFRVFGMSPTNKTSLGASALPSWAANAFSKL